MDHIKEQKNDYFKAVLNAIPLPVFVMDRDLRIIEYNEAANSLVGNIPIPVPTPPTGEVLRCLNVHRTG
ncbi:MAG: PAS domain-containing protein, partial [Planctomycetes bacterium]|nr:PAS domain-containing protein [Planctomycetota bacterium]